MAKVTISIASANTTETKLVAKLKISNMANAGTATVKFTHYLAGYPKNVKNDGTFDIGDNGDFYVNVTSLMPGKSYVITAEYTIKEVLPSTNGSGMSSTTKGSVSATGKTTTMSGSLGNKAKTTSTVSTWFIHNTKYPYGLILKYAHKMHSDKTWLENDTRTVDANKSGSTEFLFAGLKENTSYDFRVRVYRAVSSGSPWFIKTFTLTTSTKSLYDPTPQPYIKAFSEVPGTGEGTIVFGLDKEVPSGMKIYLYKESGGSYVEDTELTTPQGWEKGGLAYLYEHMPSTQTYKIGIKDADGNPQNLTDALTITFEEFNIAFKVQGDPFEVTASEVYTMADAMLKTFEYLETGVQHELAEPAGEYFDPEAVRPYYEDLKNSLDDIEAGKFIKGEPNYTTVSAVMSKIGELGNRFNIKNPPLFLIGQTNSPFTANSFNGLKVICDDAVDNI